MFKKLLYIGAVVALLAIIALVYFTYTYQATAPGNTNTVAAPTPTAFENKLDENGNSASPYGTSTYYNPLGYSIDYITDLFKQNKTTIILPHKTTNNKVTLEEFKHEIPVEHCALSGQCTPTTTDIKFGSTLLNENITAIRQTAFGKTLEVRTVSGLTVYEITQGAEGEGIVYSFIPWQDNKVIFMYRTYIDENVVLNYKSASKFIPIEEQKRIYDRVIGSLD